MCHAVRSLEEAVEVVLKEHSGDGSEFMVFVNETSDELQNAPRKKEGQDRKTQNPSHPAAIETNPIFCGVLLCRDVVHALKLVQDCGPEHGPKERKNGFKDNRKPNINLVLVSIFSTSVLAGPKESFQIVTQIAAAAAKARNAGNQCFNQAINASMKH